MVKKIISIIATLCVVGSLVIVPVYGRAGGNHSSSSSGGSSSSKNHTRPHRNSSSGESVEGLITIGIVFGGLALIKRYNQRVKAKIMHTKIKNQLNDLVDQDNFWNEKKLKKEIEACYYEIQKAWSNQDLQTLKEYLTSTLLEQWKVKLNWQEYRGQRNVLTNIRLLKKYIVDLDDDYFFVYIEGKMKDQLIEDNQVIESTNEVFVEYWKFKRVGKKIYLDEIYQQNEFGV